MRQASNNLITNLNTSSEFYCCDLYRIILADGKTYYVSAGDKDVSYQAHKYRSDMFVMSRNNIKLTGAPSVDSLSVTIYADRDHSDDIDSKYIMSAVHGGTLDDAQLTLFRAYFDSAGDFIDAMMLFSGRCEVDSCNAFQCKLTVKSEITGLAAQIPLRVFAPQNAYGETSSGQVVTASSDAYTCAIPLKPSQNVLVKL